MRRAGSVRLVVVMAVASLALAACGGNGEGPGGGEGSEEGPIRIGLLADVTGDAAACCGLFHRAAAELALEQLNEDGGIDGRQVEFIFSDTQGDKAQSVTLYNRLASNDDVVAVIGPTRTDEVVALAPIANRGGLPFVSTGSRGPFPAEFGDYAFRAAVSEEQMAEPFMEAALPLLDIGSMALIYASDDSAHAEGARFFKEAAEAHGVEVVSEETFTTGDTNYAAQITQIKNQAPEALLVAAQADDGGLIVAEAERQGLDAQLIGIGGMTSGEWFEISGGKGVGMVVASPFDPSISEGEIGQFVSAYEAAEGEAPNVDAAYGYTAASIVFEGVERAIEADNLTRDGVRDEIGNLSDFETVSGEVTFSGPGDRATLPPEDLVILEMGDDGFQPLEGS